MIKLTTDEGEEFHASVDSINDYGVDMLGGFFVDLGESHYYVGVKESPEEIDELIFQAKKKSQTSHQA